MYVCCVHICQAFGWRVCLGLHSPCSTHSTLQPTNFIQKPKNQIKLLFVFLFSLINYHLDVVSSSHSLSPLFTFMEFRIFFVSRQMFESMVYGWKPKTVVGVSGWNIFCIQLVFCIQWASHTIKIHVKMEFVYIMYSAVILISE